MRRDRAQRKSLVVVPNPHIANEIEVRRLGHIDQCFRAFLLRGSRVSLLRIRSFLRKAAHLDFGMIRRDTEPRESIRGRQLLVHVDSHIGQLFLQTVRGIESRGTGSDDGDAQRCRAIHGGAVFPREVGFLTLLADVGRVGYSP